MGVSNLQLLSQELLGPFQTPEQYGLVLVRSPLSPVLRNFRG